jgi:hypothetical protein
MSAELERVGIYRQAARVILRSGLDDAGRVKGLVNLVRRGIRERYGNMIANAVLAELTWSLDRPDVIDQPVLGDAMEIRARKLRADGRRVCPTCATPLSNEIDWQHWARLRAGAIREAQAREGAVA